MDIAQIVSTYLPAEVVAIIHQNDEKIAASMLAIIVGAILLWLGPIAFRWMSTHAWLTPAQRAMHKKDLEKRRATVSALASNIWRIIVLFCVAYAIFVQFFDRELLAPLFASAGIIGVALGFGAQSLVKDFLSGVFIVSENQYRVGDVIEVDGFGGTVERIGIRSTVLRDVDGNVHYFPNGLIQHVINKTMDYSMARFVLLVAPDTDIDRATKLINDIGVQLAKEDEWKKKIIEAPQYVMMSDFTATSISLIVSGKTQPSDQWSVVAEMRRRILAAFEHEGIEIGMDTPIPIPSKTRRR